MFSAFQFDWSHDVVLIGGMTAAVKVAHVRLCHSRMMFVQADPRESQDMASVITLPPDHPRVIGRVILRRFSATLTPNTRTTPITRHRASRKCGG